MFQEYLSAAFQTWAASKTQQGWREFWRLKKLGIQWQLRKANKIGTEIELRGPVIIRNRGTIEIGSQVIFDAAWHKPICLATGRPQARLTIENNVFINYGTEISLVDSVFIGAYSLISIDCLIYDTDWHNVNGKDDQVPSKPVHIGRGVWLGARVVVLKGVTIGDNTVVAANSMVTHSLPNNVLAGGTPARILGRIDRRRFIPPGDENVNEHESR